MIRPWNTGTAARAAAVFLAATMAATEPSAGGEIVLVNGRRARNVRFEGEPWKPDGHALRGAGPGNAMLAVPRLGRGDFALHVWLKIRGVARSAAAVRLGPNRFRFAGPGAGSPIVLEGPDLVPGPDTARRLAGTEHRIPEDRYFAFQARRVGSELTFLIDGEPVHRVRIGPRALGAFGLEPDRATLHVCRFSVSGHLEAAENRARPDGRAALQPAIEEAIERGVRFLLSRQLRDGSWSYAATRYPSGQTALCVYTLLKAGLPPGHPAVRRGLLNMGEKRPRSTYTVACHLMALQATRDEEHRPRMGELLAALLAGQNQGSWGYPGVPGGRPPRAGRTAGWTDLSNTQFAALGLRAARRAGLEVPARVWSRLLQATLAYRGPPERAPVPRGPGMSPTYRQPIRGFGYRPGGRRASGSMTAAGVATLAIGRNGLGRRLTRATDRSTREAIDLGLQWLARRFTVSRNPGRGTWLYYYLYGLERVGSLLGREQIGEHRWYREGAEFLVNKQGRHGGWPERGSLPSTCFALLFLRRATQATAPRSDRRVFRYAAGGPHDDVRIRGFGHWPMRIWISGFGPAVVERWGTEIDGRKRLRVARVEYRVDDRVVATVNGDPRKPWTDESYPIQHAFTAPGRHTVSARVHLVRPEVPAGRPGPTVAVEATGFAARLRTVFAPWMDHAARAASRNLLRGRRVKVRASSSAGAAVAGDRAVDGRESTAWLCDPSDASPAITLVVSPPVRAGRIVLGPAASRPIDRRRYDRIETAEIRIAGRTGPLEVTFPADPLEPAEVKLARPTRIQRLEIRITARTGARRLRRPAARRDRGRAGFSEIRLGRE